MSAEPRLAERGLTLLEVVVAFAIAALALGVLFDGALSGLRAARVASDYQMATALARSHLAALGSGAGLTALEQEGEDGDGFHFRIKVAPGATTTLGRSDIELAQGTPPMQATLFAVSVVESWTKDGSPREVRLETQRLAAVVTARAGP